MSTMKLIGIWFLVLVGEMVVVMGVMELWHIPWISIVVLIGIMTYDIPRRYRAIRDGSTHSLGYYYLSNGVSPAGVAKR